MLERQGNIKGTSSTLWFTPQMPATPRGGWAKQEPRARSQASLQSHVWVTGRNLSAGAASPVCLSGCTLAGSKMGSRI